MPRYHRLWNAELGKERRIRFTAAEERARDVEEAEAVIQRDTRLAKELELAQLHSELADDTITDISLRRMFRLERGMK